MREKRQNNRIKKTATKARESQSTFKNNYTVDYPFPISIHFYSAK